MATKHAQLWYLKRDNQISGPFPAGLISRHILIGRIHESDQLSPDRKKWFSALDIEALRPKPPSSNTTERVAATKRWSDERIQKDRRQNESPEKKSQYKNRAKQDRRTQEKHSTLKYRAHYRSRPNGTFHSTSIRWVTAISLFLIAGLITMQLLYTPLPRDSEQIDCNALPGPGINWDYCQKPGANLQNSDLSHSKLSNTNFSNANLQNSQLTNSNLSYATLNSANLSSAILRNATLIGSQLHEANLENADLQEADLSYSNLQNAILAGANLDKANLSYTIWIDGNTCLAGSIGQCLIKAPY